MADPVKVIKTQTNVVVDYGDILRPVARPIVLEMDDRLDPDLHTNGTVRIRKYPGEDDPGLPGFSLYDEYEYLATQGSIIFTQEIRTKNVFGRAMFTGQDRVKLPYPVIQNFGMVRVGQFFDVYGGTIATPTVQLDSGSDELVCRIPVYGTVDYAYITNYRILRYRPALFLGDEFRLIWNNSSYGTLVARHRPTFTLPVNIPKEPIPAVAFQVQPPEALNLEFELYRIESSVITDENGTWELPADWPDSGVFPGFTDPADQIDPDAPSLELKRVHEIAHFTLQDFESKTSALGSKQMMNLPLSFKYLEKDKNLSARGLVAKVGDRIMNYWDRIDPKSEEYYKNIRDFRQPKMRVTRYEQRLQKPFSANQQHPNTYRYVVAATTRNGEVENYQVLTGSYKVKLKAVRGRRPIAESTVRTIEEKNNAATDLQAAVANAGLYRAWAAIDWAAIRRAIQLQYDPRWYDLDLDELIPD